jgi:type IV pilus assembly protein PilA
MSKLRQRRDRDEAGFTLIEILVVMVIIGILAAIAIPAFLAQKDKGYQAAMKSDLQTSALAEHAYATDYNGSFTSDVVSSTLTTGPLSQQGEKTTVGVVVTATSYQSVGGVANDSYCLFATYTSRTSATYWLTSDNDTPVRTKPSVCP